MVCGHRKLKNLTLIIDRNRLQQGAGTEETSSLDPLDKRYEAFGLTSPWSTAMIPPPCWQSSGPPQETSRAA